MSSAYVLKSDMESSFPVDAEYTSTYSYRITNQPWHTMVNPWHDTNDYLEKLVVILQIPDLVRGGNGIRQGPRTTL